MASRDIGNIKSSNGNWYKIHWDDIALEVNISASNEGPFYINTARSEVEAMKIAKEEVERIERN